MKKYETYKDSGVEWIGEIPEHWDIARIKNISTIIGRIGFRGYTIQDIVSENEGAISLSPSNIVNDQLTLNNNTYLSWEKYHESPEIKIYEGDIVLVKTGSTIGKTAHIPAGTLEMTLNPQLVVLKDLKIESKYFYYTTTCPFFKSSFAVDKAGGSTPSISQEKINSFRVVVPSIEEQKSIAHYLDQKTTIIDTLLQKTKQKIALLQEQRTAIINQAVTKGLTHLSPEEGGTKGVAMKDSGVEWIGEIPEGWEFTKVKYISDLVIDGAHFTPTYVDEGVPFLRVTDIHKTKINLNKVKFIPREEHESLIRRCNPKKGDLLLSKNGTIGVTKVITWDWEFSIFVSLCLIKFKNTFSPYLFSYFFKSDVIFQQLKESSKQSTVTNLHLDKIRELKIIKPPISSQNQIVDYLDHKTKELDVLIQKQQKRIHLLKEYRQSLISEVVTGKLCVTNEIQ